MKYPEQIEYEARRKKEYEEIKRNKEKTEEHVKRKKQLANIIVTFLKCQELTIADVKDVLNEVHVEATRNAILK